MPFSIFLVDNESYFVYEYIYKVTLNRIKNDIQILKNTLYTIFLHKIGINNE